MSQTFAGLISTQPTVSAREANRKEDSKRTTSNGPKEPGVLRTNSSNVDAEHHVDATDVKDKSHGVIPGASAEENWSRLSPEKERQLREMYERLDLDHDGSLDLRDLTRALDQNVPHIPSGYAPRLLERMAPCERVTFPDFVRYVTHQEQKLEKMFRDLDRDKDGLVDMYDLQLYADRHGVPLSGPQSTHIVQKIGADKMKDSIDLGKFQQFMLWYPSSDPQELLTFWKHKLVIDLGEDSLVPEDFSTEELRAGVWWRHLVAGGMAGAVSRTCTAPLDRLKVYLQVNSTKNNRLTLLATFKLLYAEGKLKSFWRGNGINVAKIAPESAMKFAVYEQLKHHLHHNKSASGELSLPERVLCGSAAGAISQTAIYPLEVLKTRLALRRTGQMDKGLIHFAYKLYRNEGVFCFYKGYVPNLLGIMPYAGIDLAIYETLRNYYTRHHSQNSEPTVAALLICGTVSSTCGQLASYPFSLVKTRLQALKWSVDPTQPASMFGQFRYIVANEGPLGLYRGIAPNFLKVIPAVSISYVVYEHVRRYLGATVM